MLEFKLDYDWGKQRGFCHVVTCESTMFKIEKSECEWLFWNWSRESGVIHKGWASIRRLLCKQAGFYHVVSRDSAELKVA